MFVEMRRRGYRPVERPASGPAAARARAAESTLLFASLVLPWIRIHGEEKGQADLDGTVVDSVTRQRILFARAEAALLLLGLAEFAGTKRTESLLASISRLCRDAARGFAPGTSFFQHTGWDEEGSPETGAGKVGPVDSRRLAAELLGESMLSAPKKRQAGTSKSAAKRTASKRGRPSAKRASSPSGRRRL